MRYRICFSERMTPENAWKTVMKAAMPSAIPAKVSPAVFTARVTTRRDFDSECASG